MALPSWRILFDVRGTRGFSSGTCLASRRGMTQRQTFASNFEPFAASRKWLWLPVLGAVIALASAACNSSTDGTDGAASGAGFGCCPLPDRPTGTCSLTLGGAKHSANDQCLGPSDGVLPDTTAPGWTVVNDADGCPAWTPPANVPRIACGAQFDAGRALDAGDGGD